MKKIIAFAASNLLAVSVLGSVFCLGNISGQTDVFAAEVDVSVDSYGDVNGDGSISVFDISVINNYLSGTATLSERERIYGDLNADGKVNEDDSQIIIDIYLKQNSDYVSKCRNAWYKKYSNERMYSGVTYKLYKDHAEVISCSPDAGKVVKITSSIEGLPVTKIAEQGLANSSSFTNVVIPNSVTSIGKLAFWNCKNLAGVVLPDSVTYIGDSAFVGCNSMKFINLSKNLKEIGAAAFWLCDSLESVEIPKSVDKIGNRAFVECSMLQKIIIWNENCQLGASGSADSLSLIPQWTTVYGYKGSTAEEYAKAYGLSFIALSDNSGGTSSESSNKGKGFGDINSDNDINALDASLVLTAYASTAIGKDSGLTDTQKKSADVNKDGAIDALDASVILSYYAYTATGGTGSLADFLNK